MKGQTKPRNDKEIGERDEGRTGGTQLERIVEETCSHEAEGRVLRQGRVQEQEIKSGLSCFSSKLRRKSNKAFESNLNLLAAPYSI